MPGFIEVDRTIDVESATRVLSLGAGLARHDSRALTGPPGNPDNGLTARL